MPAASTVKTVWARRVAEVSLNLVWLFALVIPVIGAIVWVARSDDTTTLKTPNKEYRLEIASSLADQTKGLGGRDSMPADRGMLFTYAKPAKLCFWMKDMRFPIDIVWLDAAKRVVHQEAAVSPQTYPKNYCPEVPAMYVIELNAGEYRRAGITPGAQLSF